MQQKTSEEKTKRSTLLVLIYSGLILLLFCFGCSRDSDESELKTGGFSAVTLQTNWVPQPEDGGFFHAKQLGLFEQEGIYLNIQPASAGMNIYSYIAAGEAEFGITVLSKLLVAIDKGLPLVAVASYRPASLRVLLVHDQDPIQGFPDLDQRVIKARGEDLWLKYLQKKYALDLRVIPHDFGVGQFIARPDLVQQGLLTSEPYTLRENGVAVRVLELKDAGWENMEVIFCRTDFLEKNPDLVRGVARASIEGWRRYLLDGKSAEETNQWLSVENPARSIESMRWARDALAKMYADSGVFGNGSFGEIDPEKVMRMVDNLLDLGAIKKPLPIESIADLEVAREL